MSDCSSLCSRCGISHSQWYGSDSEKRDWDTESVRSNGSFLSSTSTLASQNSTTGLLKVVSWESDEDVANPQNWTKARKWTVTILVSAFAFLSLLASSTVSPSLSQISREFGLTSKVTEQLILSLYLLGNAIGPFVVSPMSESFGRANVIQGANVLQIIFNLVCGFARSPAQLMVFRFFAGLGGSATLGIGSAVIRDVWRAEERSRGLCAYSLAPWLGPAIGPIVGGFIADSGKYRLWSWAFWSVTPVSVMLQVLAFFFLRETYAPTILGRKAQVLREKTGDDNLRTEWDVKSESSGRRMRLALTRPWRLLGTQPIVQVLALYQAYNYGLLYLFISSFPGLWTGRYGFRPGVAGLNYLAIIIGCLASTQICGPLNDKLYMYLKRRYHYDDGTPEFRIPLMGIGALLTPAGLLWYGWFAQVKAFWFLPDIGVAAYAFGTLICYQCIQTYLVDSYATYAASASAAAAFLRSLAAFTFPLFAPYLFQHLDYGWGCSLLGFVAIGLGLPAPILFWRYGAALRKRSNFARD